MGPAGSGLTGAPAVSASNVQTFVAEPATREKVSAILRDYGLEVRRVSPLSILVEAPVRQLERVFKAKVLEAPTGSGRSWASPPILPADLADLVDAVILPQPAKLAAAK